MSYDVYILDSGPFGLAAHPKFSPDSAKLKAWLASTLVSGARVVVPEVVEFEVRRELIRAGKTNSVARLDALADRLGTLPVDRQVWRLASELWAEARLHGVSTAPDAALDADVILVAVARLATKDGASVLVVTGNVGHLGRFVDAMDWRALADQGAGR
jgi:predicted nucleic acid-binding protein